MTRSLSLRVLLPALAALLAGLAVGAAGWVDPWFATGDAETILLRTEPAGAAVTVDGVYRGRGPLSLRLPVPGRYRLRVTAEGYLPHHAAWTPISGTEHRVALRPRPTAALAVRSEPSGATVVVGGATRGRTPLELDGLPPGRTSVTLLLTNHIPETRAVDLSPGEPTELSLDLRHRQVEAYRALLAERPHDIQVHNDLVRLLFVLGRDRDAARAILDALEILGDEGARRRHPEEAEKTWKEFQAIHRQKGGRIARVLDEEVVRALAEDTVSARAARAYVQNRGPWNDPRRLEQVLAAALLHGRFAQAAPLIDAVADTGNRRALFGAVDRVLEAEALDGGTAVLLLETLRHFAGRLDGEARTALLERFGTLLGTVSAAEVPPAEVPRLLIARVWYMGRVGVGEGREALLEELRAAIRNERNARLRQELRLELARLEFEEGNLETARELARAIVEDRSWRSRENLRAARELLERIAVRERGGAPGAP
jgi:hypothetical protein